MDFGAIMLTIQIFTGRNGRKNSSKCIRYNFYILLVSDVNFNLTARNEQIPQSQ